VTDNAEAGVLLRELLAVAGLPPAESTELLTGHGFDHEITVATLAGGRQVVLRRRMNGDPLDPAFSHAGFFAAHDVPAPAVLASTERAVLVEYIPGEMLSELVASGRCTEAGWRSVGDAFRRLHAVRFPSGLAGRFEQGRIVLTPHDPVATLHAELAAADLTTMLPEATKYVPRLHALIDSEADQLRRTPTSLLHADVNAANIIVASDRTVLIDWGHPLIGDPRGEIAALDEHVYLAGGGELPDAFFSAYGVSRADLRLPVHRLTGTIGWLAGEDWDEWAADLTPELAVRTARWHTALVRYLQTELPQL
jgi:aminoglycoside phosphotransferase (APT) family kinase protein